MNLWEVAVITILSIILIYAAYSFYSAATFKVTMYTLNDKLEKITSPEFPNGKRPIDFTVTRGMNGFAGSTIRLKCPTGQKISFAPGNTTTTRGSLICNGSSACDAFVQPNKLDQKAHFFNPLTTIDVFAENTPFTDLKSGEGQNDYTWVVPDNSDSRIPSNSCLKSCANISFVGTYDCVPDS